MAFLEVCPCLFFELLLFVTAAMRSITETRESFSSVFRIFSKFIFGETFDEAIAVDVDAMFELVFKQRGVTQLETPGKVTFSLEAMRTHFYWSYVFCRTRSDRILCLRLQNEAKIVVRIASNSCRKFHPSNSSKFPSLYISLRRGTKPPSHRAKD